MTATTTLVLKSIISNAIVIARSASLCVLAPEPVPMKIEMAISLIKTVYNHDKIATALLAHMPLSKASQ